MRRNCCHTSLAFLLKFLNFLQAFVGISAVLYSIWMLDQWRSRVVPVAPPPSNSAPSPDSASYFSQSLSIGAFDLIVGSFFGFGDDRFNSFRFPAPWFIYSFMGIGIILCCITFTGCIAAESINGCCLCFYTILKTVLILVEAALVAFIAIDHQWEKDLPFDSTGELENLQSFVEDNVDICKWFGITVVTIQVLALLLAMVLRAMVSPRRNEFECEDDYENARGRTWEPLLSQPGQTSGSAATHSDFWSSRMKEKYGLNNGDKSNLLNQNASMSTKSN